MGHVRKTHLDARLPGVSARTRADAVMAPSICAMQYSKKRTGVITPTRSSAKEMLGLKHAPVTRKKIHAEISKLNPIQVEIYRTFSMVEPAGVPLALSALTA